MQTGASWLVPAPMKEETAGIIQPLDSAGTYRKAAS